jgi:hypothetical protein
LNCWPGLFKLEELSFAAAHFEDKSTLKSLLLVYFLVSLLLPFIKLQAKQKVNSKSKLKVNFVALLFGATPNLMHESHTGMEASILLL